MGVPVVVAAAVMEKPEIARGSDKYCALERSNTIDRTPIPVKKQGCIDLMNTTPTGSLDIICCLPHIVAQLRTSTKEEIGHTSVATSSGSSLVD